MGYDIHPLKKGRNLYLGGIKIGSSWGLEGHSDADVILHALSDALLGACAEKDIGYYFPNEPRFKGMRSTRILKKALGIMRKNKFRIENMDILVISNFFKVSCYRERLRENLSKLLGIGKGRISLKGKSNQGLGVFSSNKAIACFVVCSLTKVR